MPILNYTTAVAVSKTVGEVTALLARAGASRVTTVHDGERVAGVELTLPGAAGDHHFALPVNIEGVHAALLNESGLSKQQRTEAHAEKVAWRIAKVWLEAQIALIDAQMATLHQVMLPYQLARPDGSTVWDVYREQQQSALPTGASDADPVRDLLDGNRSVRDEHAVRP